MTTRPTGQRGRLDTDPLTLNQLGRIHAEFARLGFRPRDRAERLRITAVLAESGPIGSTKDLTMGEAGRAVNALTRCLTTDDLYSMTEPEPAPRGILAALIAWLTPARPLSGKLSGSSDMPAFQANQVIPPGEGKREKAMDDDPPTELTICITHIDYLRSIGARVATDEDQAHGIPAGLPVLVIDRGTAPELAYRADRVRFVMTPAAEPDEATEAARYVLHHVVEQFSNYTDDLVQLARFLKESPERLIELAARLRKETEDGWITTNAALTSPPPA